MLSTSRILSAFVLASTALAASSCSSLEVRNTGESAGYFKNVSGIEMYISPPATNTSTPSKALLYLTDIFGVPLSENRLLADSLASNDYLVVMPDLFAGDAIPLGSLEAGLNLTGWLAKHGPEEIDRIFGETVEYMRGELGISKIGGLGYCFGGKYVPRWMTGEGKVDLGFIAHPSFLTEGEIDAVKGGLSIAAGTLDDSFNATAKVKAEAILNDNKTPFQSNLYYGAPHGFAVRANLSDPLQAYAKQASFVQAVTWFDAWL